MQLLQILGKKCRRWGQLSKSVARIAAICWLYLAFMVVAIEPISAVEMNHIFKKMVLVTGQQADLRAREIRTALSEIFLRVSGQQAVLSHQEVIKAISEADRYLLQFSYQLHELPPEQQWMADGETRYELHLSFDHELILEVLQNARLPMWDMNRPKILVWWGISARGNRFILGQGEQDRYAQLLKQAADRRAVPVIFPLLDSEDRIWVNSSDIWGFFLEAIKQASVRYQADILLIGYAEETSYGWDTKWQMHSSEIHLENEIKNRRIDRLLSEVIDLSVESLAEHYAIVPDQVDPVRIALRVQGVTTLTDYADVLKILDRLSFTRQLMLHQLSKEILEFHLVLDSDIKQFQRAMALNRQLQLLNSEIPTTIGMNPVTGEFDPNLILEPLESLILTYRWRSITQ